MADVQEYSAPAASAALFFGIAVLIGVDVASDYRAGTASSHLTIEMVVMALALTGVVLLWQAMRSARRLASELGGNLAAAEADAQRWRLESQLVVRGLGEAIDRQFQRWNLTDAEREVGLLLLKGLSHREVAAARQTSEKTVRQQALALYRKGGLSGRTGLAAFFLEDLLLPGQAPEFSRTPPASKMTTG